MLQYNMYSTFSTFSDFSNFCHHFTDFIKCLRLVIFTGEKIKNGHRHITPKNARACEKNTRETRWKKKGRFSAILLKK